MDTIVIGAGLAGLSAASHLHAAGHRVTVLEAASIPGGRAGSCEIDGYRFDTGPTVLTMPDLVEDCFRALGTTTTDHVRILPVDPMYRACYADGSVLHVRHGREAMAAEISAVCGPREAAAFHRFCDWLGELYRIEMPNFIDRNYDSPLDLVRPLGPALRLLRAGAFGRLDSAVKRFFSDERLVRIFSFQAMYAGLAPQQALALYAVITYMDSVNGVYRPPRAECTHCPLALAGSSREHPVSRSGTTRRVERILLSPGHDRRRTRRSPRRAVQAPLRRCGRLHRPISRWPTASLLPGVAGAATRPVRGHYSPSRRWSGTPAFPARSPKRVCSSQHPLRSRLGRRIVRSPYSMTAVRMTDPSILVTIPTMDEPAMAPPGKQRTVRAGASAQPRRPAVDWSDRTRPIAQGSV